MIKKYYQLSLPKSTKPLFMPEKTKMYLLAYWHFCRLPIRGLGLECWRSGSLPLLSHKRNYNICNCWWVHYSKKNQSDFIFSALPLLLERHIFAKSGCFCQNIQSANPEGWSSFLNSACSKSTQVFYGVCLLFFRRHSCSWARLL